MPLKRLPQRKYLPGKWVTLDDQLPTIPVAAATPSLDEVIRLIQRWLITKNPEGVPAGLMELNPANLIDWLNQQIDAAREEHGDLGERNLNGIGITPVKNPTDAEIELMHSATLADQQRLQIAKSVAKRRGIRLADALKHVP